MGWLAGATSAGIKTYNAGRLDLGVLVSERPCAVAGLFTTNKVCGAPIELNRARIRESAARAAGGTPDGIRALVVNSGCSNVAMGERGRRDAARMAELMALRLGIAPESVLVGSTGVIGRPLPMDRIEEGIARLEVSPVGGPDFSQAIMTTDRVPKVRALEFDYQGVRYTVAGTAKGSGMAHPDLATVFCFLTTDAAVDVDWLQQALRRVADASLNLLDIDMDTSTSDMMLAFANGAAGGSDLARDAASRELLEGALLRVAVELTRDLARDGEGASTLIEAEVRGAQSLVDARRAARAVVSSPLIKSMITGRDANLGRVLMALGRSGAELDVERTSVWIGEHLAFSRGAPTELDLEVISRAMEGDTVRLVADLGLGSHSAMAWGCNLTEDYVRINADYTT